MKKSGSSKPGSDGGNYENALQRAAGLCSRQEQCTSHIREKLRNWNVADRDAEKIIRKLTEEKFLDDGRYAGSFARDKFKLNSWGKIKITHILKQKRVGEAEIENALSQIDQESWFHTCLEIIRGKSASLREENPFNRRGKLFRFAAGRGFEPDMIYKALDQIEKE
ncbi:MAG: RecX family transcriptional regulator [Bacteroidetes bacterium]|nr:RecX family transcriptional regulator [Bacteroidota bacterium]